MTLKGRHRRVKRVRRVGRCPFTRLITLCRIPRLKRYVDVSNESSDISCDETPLVEPVNWSYYQEEETNVIGQSDGELSAEGGVNPDDDVVHQTSPEWSQVRFGINNHHFLPSSHQYQSWQDMFGQHRGHQVQEASAVSPFSRPSITPPSTEMPPSMANLFRQLSNQTTVEGTTTSHRSSNSSSLPAFEVESSSSDEEPSLMERRPSNRFLPRLTRSSWIMDLPMNPPITTPNNTYCHQLFDNNQHITTESCINQDVVTLEGDAFNTESSTDPPEASEIPASIANLFRSNSGDDTTSSHRSSNSSGLPSPVVELSSTESTLLSSRTIQRRILQSELVNPPAYDDIVTQPYSCFSELDIPGEPPPPYSDRSDSPPPYDNQDNDSGDDLVPEAPRSFGLLGGRPPMRWNCSMRVEQWASGLSSNWSVN